MDPLPLIGLLFTFAGGIIVLIPNNTRQYSLLHKLPPFSKIEYAERQLYQLNGEIRRGEKGFKYLSNALMSSSQPFDSTTEPGAFSRYSAKFPSRNGTVEVDFQDCELLSIKKKSKGGLSDSDFSAMMVPKESSEAFEAIIRTGENEIPAIEAEIPNGRFPDMVKEYKRGIVSKIGMVFLLMGTVVLMADYLPYIPVLDSLGL